MLSRRVKFAINRLLARFGYRIERIVPPPMAGGTSFSEDPLLAHTFEQLVARIHSRIQPGEFFFVQVGAYDGLTNDPLHAYVRRYGWRGVLVEPQEVPFQALKANYSDQVQLAFLNAAVGDRDGFCELYVVPEAAGQPEWSSQIASFRREVILKHDHDHLAVDVPRGVENLSEILETRTVNVITFDTLIERFGIDRIDLLQIDAEGYDAELLKQFDFKRLKPAIICYEHVHLEKEEQRDCLELLAGHGYRFSVGISDSLAYLP